ncbi:hypothetical protein M8494_29040 [Serratia ureilytica]
MRAALIWRMRSTCSCSPVHHIISDGWSTGILLRELGRCTRFASRRCRSAAAADAAIPGLCRLAASLSDAGRLAAQAQYARNAERCAALLTLPTDRPRPTVQSFSSGEVPTRSTPS